MKSLLLIILISFSNVISASNLKQFMGGSSFLTSELTIDSTLITGHEYIINPNGGTALNLTLPATCKVGEKIKLISTDSGRSYKLLPGAGQNIHYNGNSAYITASGSTQTVMKCSKTNLHWVVSKFNGSGSLNTNCIGIGTSIVLDYVGSIVNYTVPAGCNTITIETWGAQGGDTHTSCVGVGGLGTYMKGSFSGKGGATLKILVGQKGGAANGNAGGGGGSFVTDNNNIPLVISGGGGGYGCSYAASNAVITSIGVNGNTTVTAGGSSGAGGTGGTGGPGGAGLTGNGGASSCIQASAPLSFINGGTGGSATSGYSATYPGGYGGFGGGGGACHGWTSGAGGGYSGGGGPTLSGRGGGGSSFNAGTAQTNTAAQTAPGANGNGRVVITLIN